MERKHFAHFAVTILLGVFGFLDASAFAPDPEDSTRLSGDDKALMKQGNQLLTDGLYGDALPIWQQIVEKDSTNANANFKLGLCYRRTLDQQPKALPYFIAAVEAMTDKYSFQDAELQESPYDALYFLAEAWLANSEPDSAYANYVLYQDYYNGDPPIAVERQMLMCSNAQRYLKQPRNVTIDNMGDLLNSAVPESNPVLTIDNSVIFFASRRLRPDDSNKEIKDPNTGFPYADIYYAKKDAGGTWSKPLVFRWAEDSDEFPMCVSADGTELYFSRQDGKVTNIYTSVFSGGAWQEPKALSAVNSAFNENGITISGTGDFLCFSSDREGGLGHYDLYGSKKKKNGSWGRPYNLGSVINTEYDEVSPFVHPNGQTLFFSSNGNINKGMGGYDIYYAELNAGTSWQEPQTMGYPINSTRDDINYYITEGGTRYYARLTEDQSYDLYSIVGGGFDVENFEGPVEVVTLTEEMDVTEVLEVTEEVQTEVEVVEVVEAPVDEVPEEIEIIDLGAFDEVVELPMDSAMTEEVVEEPELSLVEQINMDSLSESDRDILIEKVKAYLTVAMEENEEVNFKTVYFDFGIANLNVLSKNELKAFVEFLNENPDTRVEVIGHTDNVGSYAVNLNLSAKRAQEVHDFLVRNKVSADRIVYYGKGYGEPSAKNDSEAGRKLNRRVEVKIVR